MILGRSTPAWLAMFTAAGALAQVLLVNLTTLDATIVATVIGAIVAFLGAFLAFLANTATTPVSDPVLPSNTVVRVQGTTDTVTIQPTPPGPTGGDQNAHPPQG